MSASPHIQQLLIQAHCGLPDDSQFFPPEDGAAETTAETAKAAAAEDAAATEEAKAVAAKLPDAPRDSPAAQD